MPRAKIQDRELFYDSRGNGEALVLIPGFASGAWLWRKQAGDLSQKFRVITFDPAGIAGSEKSDKPLTIVSLAEDIAALLDHLEIGRAHLLGSSFGGFIAQEFALAFPERLGKLILACTSYGGKGHIPPSMEVLAAFASTRGLNTEERMKESQLVAFNPGFVSENPAEVEDFCRMRAENFVPEEIYLQQLSAALAFDTSARVGNISAPTLVLTGDNDIIVPPQNSHNLAAAIPNSELRVIDGGSHMFFVEQANEFNKIVTEFLESR